MSIIAILAKLAADLRARDWLAAAAGFQQLLEALLSPQHTPDPIPARAPGDHPRTFNAKSADTLAHAIEEFVAAHGGAPPPDSLAAPGGRIDWRTLLGKLLPLIIGFFG